MELENSFNEEDRVELDSVIAEFPHGDDNPSERIPVKKLCEMFDTIARSEPTASTGNGLKVYLRVRPIPDKIENTISIESDTMITTNAPESSKRAQYTKKEERNYSFHRVFGPLSEQTDIFDHITMPLIEKFVRGESCVLFAYGMTNAGKTYTVQGSAQNPGILPRLVNSIVASHASSILKVSMLEIYQEKIFDLLGKKKEKLNIRDGGGKVEVLKLSSHPVSSAQESLKLLAAAAANRTKCKTALNQGSSRSHAVYSLSLEQVVDGKDVSSIFYVVDLAGAERSNRTKATASQQKEANNINMSLMQLWRCLQGMKKKGGEDIVPFRESKLTHLMMPLLSRAGTNGVAMIACVNPQEDDYDETLTVLGNASIACKIREIADLGRTSSMLIPSSRSSTLFAAPALASASAGAAGGGAVSVTAMSSGPEESTKSVIRVGIVEQKKRKLEASGKASLTTTSHRESTLTMKEKKAGELSLKSSLPLPDETVSVSDLCEENKRLKKEFERMEEENRALLTDQLSREATIRMEVSLEMAERSADLLEQIQNLQRQLYEKEDSINEVSKSCKKLKQRNLRIAHEDSLKSVREAEDEMERTKMKYEEEISKLKEEKKILIQQLDEWRHKASHFESVIHDLKLSISSGVTAAQPMECASEFSQRMQRDGRFKKEKETTAPVSVVAEGKRSPVRSPLSPLKSDGNSPIRLEGLNMLKKKTKSPPNVAATISEVANDENIPGPAPISKRLRSHQGKPCFVGRN